MPRLFISYSRVDRPFIEDFVPLVRDMWGYENVWFDDNLHGGQIWWEEILQQIAACDIFVYLLSNESITSEYCEAEYQEAQRLQKQILPVQIRARTSVPDELKRVQFVDMSAGIRHDNLNKFQVAVKRLSDKIPATPPQPLDSQPVPRPSISDARHKRKFGTRKGILAFVVAILLIAAFFVLLNQVNNPGQNTASTETVTATSAIAFAPTDEPTATTEPASTIEPASPTFTPSLTDTPLPPTNTATVLPSAATYTPTPTDTATFTNTPVPPSDTPTATFSYTPLPPTETPTPTYTWKFTSSPLRQTNTYIPTRTPTPTATRVIETTTNETVTASCFVRTDRSDVAIYVGPGENRSVRGALPANVDILVTGQAQADDGSMWWRIQPSDVTTELDRYWVAQEEVNVASACESVEVVSASSVVPITSLQQSTNQSSEGSASNAFSMSIQYVEEPHRFTNLTYLTIGINLYFSDQARQLTDPQNPEFHVLFEPFVGSRSMFNPNFFTTVQNPNVRFGGTYLVNLSPIWNGSECRRGVDTVTLLRVRVANPSHSTIFYTQDFPVSIEC